MFWIMGKQTLILGATTLSRVQTINVSSRVVSVSDNAHDIVVDMDNLEYIVSKGFDIVPVS